MRFVLDLLIIVIKVLIAIGDFVIFLASQIVSIARLITKLYSSIKTFAKDLAKTRKNKIQKEGSKNKKILFIRLHVLLLKVSEIPIFILGRFYQLRSWVIRFFEKLGKSLSFLTIGQIPKGLYSRVSLPALAKERFGFRLPFRKRGGRKPKIFPTPLLSKIKYFSAGVFFSFMFGFMPLLSIIFIQSLPNPRELISQDIAQSTKIYDRSGSLLYQIYANQNRTLVPLSEIPDSLRDATIATEDKNFYSSPGFDLLAIARSAVADITGQPLQGGSTITQQLIKSRLLSPQRSIVRKAKEIILAFWAQRIYTKDQILEMYFNQVPYGGTAWGAQAAAQTYFGKNAQELDLAQSAFLAGLPQAPSVYSPYSGDSSLWKTRQEEVLGKMVSLGYISASQANLAKSEKLTFEPPSHVLHAPHFVMYVRDLLSKKYGITMVERGGLNVVTSLDLKKQEEAERIVRDEVENDAYLNVHNGAALVTNPKNGNVLVMVGGKDYYDPNGGNFNVTTALRQPGSTIKVVTYTAALMNGFTAATPILDAPIAFASHGSPSYAPVNYDGKFHGTLTLRQALGNSINVPAVKTLNTIGIDKMVDMAKKMGITTWGNPKDYGLALTLGAAEVKMVDMAQVYGTLANMGKRVDLNPILKVTDYQGNVLEEKGAIEEHEVIPQAIAFILSDILSDNSARALEFGSSSPLVIPGHNVSVKTGTTDNKRDNWTIGYTPSFLAGVWVGNNDNSPLNPTLASGITGAAPIWHKIMENLLGSTNNLQENYSPPADIVSKPCVGRIEYFVKGTENSVSCRIIPLPSPSPSPASP